MALELIPGKTLDQTIAAKPAAGLIKGGTPIMPEDEFVKVVYWDLTGKFRSPSLRATTK